MTTTLPPALVQKVTAVDGVRTIHATCPSGVTVRHGGGPEGTPLLLGPREPHCRWARRPASLAPCTHGAYELTLGVSPETAALQRAASTEKVDDAALARALRAPR